MIPRNEMEVLVLFVQGAAEAGFEIISAQQAFPDLHIRRDGIDYKAEVEFVASSFERHQHRHDHCDVIICWENDRSEDYVLPILALSDKMWKEKPIVVPSNETRELVYWKTRATRLEKKLMIKHSLVEANVQEDRDKHEVSEAYELCWCGAKVQRKPQAKSAHSRKHTNDVRRVLAPLIDADPHEHLATISAELDVLYGRQPPDEELRRLYNKYRTDF